MISIYKNSNSGLVALPEITSGSWINVINPTPDEVACIQELGVPQDYLLYPLDLDERARTERENGELLIVLRIPYFNGKDADVPYTTIPLGIILTPNHIITVCKLENDILREFANGRVRDMSTNKRLRFILRILLATATKYLNYLREITKVIDQLEDQLQKSTRNKEVLDLLKYQKSLTYFTTALKSNELMMERLQRSQLLRTYPEDEDLLEDVLTENQQAIEMTNITSNILSSMMDAFASIISNNLNVVMKFLASITIVLSLPATVAAFFGMNVTLPFEFELRPAAFVIIVLISFVISVGAAYLFWRRDWL
jgi:magnesium transporter